MRAPPPVNLLGLDRPALALFMRELGEKEYRAAQVFRRLHRGDEDPFADLPERLRSQLRGETVFSEPPLAADLLARDGTRKLLFSAGEDKIDSVLIPQGKRLTLCVSTQAGCPLACRFCLTGKQGFSQNLSAAQIVGQLRVASRLAFPRRVTNVVMMGMGEPLLNLPALLPALRVMTDSIGFALPPRRVTVSTAGVVPAMKILREGAKCALAVSLHAASDSLRDELMPINRKYPLAQLMEECREHIRDSRRDFVTMEYVMLKGINDGAACARDLARLVRGLRCKINLIPFNVFSGAEFLPSPPENILQFRDSLMKSGLTVTIRQTRGEDILAACGQLAGEVREGRKVFPMQKETREEAR